MYQRKTYTESVWSLALKRIQRARREKVQRKALFHKWDEIKQVIDASPMIGGHPGGQIAYTLGIVEFMDGTVGQVHPGYIKFLDTEDFAGDCNE